MLLFLAAAISKIKGSEREKAVTDALERYKLDELESANACGPEQAVTDAPKRHKLDQSEFYNDCGEKITSFNYKWLRIYLSLVKIRKGEDMLSFQEFFSKLNRIVDLYNTTKQKMLDEVHLSLITPVTLNFKAHAGYDEHLDEWERTTPYDYCIGPKNDESSSK